MLVDHDDRAFLADFGLTKGARERGITRTGQYLGSLDYVSPEQIKGGTLSSRERPLRVRDRALRVPDGEVPFPRETEAALLYAHLSEPPPSVSAAGPVAARPPSTPCRPRPREGAGGPVRVRDRARRRRARGARDRHGARRGAVHSSGRPGAGDHCRLVRRRPRRASARPSSTRRLVREAPSIEAAKPRREVPSSALKALAIAIPVLAFLGFLIGRSGGEEQEPARNVAVAGPLALRFTEDWELLADQEPIAGLELTDPIALAHGDEDHPAELHAGVAAEAEGALVLPPALIAQLDEVPSAATVRLGAVPALRYSGLHHRELDGELTLYVVPTRLGAATIACVTQPVAAEDDTGPSGAARCEDVATTLTLRGTQPRSLGPDERYGSAVDAVLGEARRGASRLAHLARGSRDAGRAALARAPARQHLSRRPLVARPRRARPRRGARPPRARLRARLRGRRLRRAVARGARRRPGRVRAREVERPRRRGLAPPRAGRARQARLPRRVGEPGRRGRGRRGLWTNWHEIGTVPCVFCDGFPGSLDGGWRVVQLPTQGWGVPSLRRPVRRGRVRPGQVCGQLSASMSSSRLMSERPETSAFFARS